MKGIKTIEQARDYVLRVGVCTIFSGKVADVPSLWDIVDLPDRTGGRTKWGARIEAIWQWKNELPARYPDEIFYGKITGGVAVLMSMDHLREVHYPAAHQPVSACSELAQKIYEIIRLNPAETPEIRAEAIERYRCTKTRFDTALKQLQVTLNITRSNDPDAASDRWVVWREQYFDIGQTEDR